ncbi:PE-PPE domain-containing protein [Mycobacterium sp. NAZ190054]|uniref:PE-PPE domain-containing protein n=1 Tax=Mycobacterium sp. NAZ190054 TaxID=1747766 RepID=UPI00079702DE|nr:PE-PPE domain-containing protein [Mycobacterium sp. NAZ190054]KWX65667.1 hypothetical protein ASJ79_07680 [Mycobacterium sp. NAZ190054]
MKRLVTFIGVIAVAFAPAVANGATALLVGGKGGYAELTDEQMSTAFGGFFGEYNRVSVPFPGADDFAYSVDEGTKSLYDAVVKTLEANPDERITIGGVSEGAPAVDRVLRMLMALNPDERPDPEHFNVMIYGAPNPLMMNIGGVPYQPLPETPYHVMIVMAEYDGVSDFPDNPFNLLAVVNAVMGGVDLHVDAAWTDIFTVPTMYYIDTNDAGGSVTTVLIPTPLLPLLQPLLEWGFEPEFVNFMDDVLRPIIDSAYNRPRWTVGIPPNLDEMQLSDPPAPQPAPPPADPAPSGPDQRVSSGPAPVEQTRHETGYRSGLIEPTTGSGPTVVFEPDREPVTQVQVPESTEPEEDPKPADEIEGAAAQSGDPQAGDNAAGDENAGDDDDQNAGNDDTAGGDNGGTGTGGAEG